MPARKPMYMSFKVTGNNFGRFRANFEGASYAALQEVGRQGRDRAKEVLASKQKNRSRRTQRSIAYRVVTTRYGKAVAITTGTLAGVFVEVGAQRSHSSMEGYHYLREGGQHASRALLPEVAVGMRRRPLPKLPVLRGVRSGLAVVGKA